MLGHLVWKDIRRELRGKEGLQAGLVLVALFFVVYLLAFRRLDASDPATAIVLWMPVVFATAAVVGRGTGQEIDRGTIELLRSLPVPSVLHGVSRTLVDLGVATVVAATSLLLAGVLFSIPLPSALVAVALLATLGLVVVGALTGALAAQARARELLLPILMVPVLFPLIHTAVGATTEALGGASFSRLAPALGVLAGYDLVAAGVSWLLWPIVLEAD